MGMLIRKTGSSWDEQSSAFCQKNKHIMNTGDHNNMSSLGPKSFHTSLGA